MCVCADLCLELALYAVVVVCLYEDMVVVEVLDDKVAPAAAALVHHEQELLDRAVAAPHPVTSHFPTNPRTRSTARLFPV